MVRVVAGARTALGGTALGAGAARGGASARAGGGAGLCVCGAAGAAATARGCEAGVLMAGAGAWGEAVTDALLTCTAAVCRCGTRKAQRAAPVNSAAAMPIRRQGGRGMLSADSMYSMLGSRWRRRLRCLAGRAGVDESGTSWCAHLRQNLADSRLSAPHLEQVRGMQRRRV